MKKEIKDYLHLYLGNKCMFKESGKYSEHYEYGIVLQKPVSGTEWGVWCAEDERMYFSFYHDIKLVLRPMTDITKEEMEVASKLCGVVNLFNTNRDDKFNYVKHEAEHIAYLLKQGFDVFDLIEDGLAVDEKTLTEQKV